MRPASRRLRILSLLSLICLFLAWEFASRLRFVSQVFLPAPSKVLMALSEMALSGELWPHFSISLKRIGLGLLLGVCLGWAVGVLTGLQEYAEAVLGPLLALIYPIPKVAIFPLLILYLGIGEASKVAVIAIGVFFPIYINMKTGVKNVDQDLILAARSLGTKGVGILRKVIVPASVPHFLSGLKLATGISLLLLVTAEMIGANQGVGHLILRAADLMMTDRLLAGILVLSCLGLVLAYLVEALERAWHVR